MAAQSRNIAELENASVWRLLVQYSLPSIAGMVVYSLYNIIDSVFIGHGVGPLALSVIYENTHSYSLTLYFFSGCFVLNLVIALVLKWRTSHHVILQMMREQSNA